MKRILGLVLFALIPVCSFAVDTGTVTITNGGTENTYWINMAWTSNTGGGVVESDGIKFFGEILRVVTDPGDGSSSPTANYDITLTDVDGADVLNGGGANRSQSAVEQIIPSITSVGTKSDFLISVAGDLTLTIAAAGNTKTGSIRVYYRRN